MIVKARATQRRRESRVPVLRPEVRFDRNSEFRYSIGARGFSGSEDDDNDDDDDDDDNKTQDG